MAFSLGRCRSVIKQSNAEDRDGATRVWAG